MVAIEPGAQQYLPQMVMSISDYRQRLTLFQAFVKQNMKEGQDYGKVGDSSKPSLLQPGAQKLCEMYSLAPVFDIVDSIKDWEHGFFYFEIRCSLFLKGTQVLVAQGLGSCNSKEGRYAYRWVTERKLPPGVAKGDCQSRQLPSKNGGTFSLYRVENEDPYSLVNTIEKMACKRALVAATLQATRSSGIFTQDLEDIIEGEGYVVEEPSQKPREPKPAPKPPRAASPPGAAQAADPAEDPSGPPTCHDCKKVIVAYTDSSGKKWEPTELVDFTRARFPYELCGECLTARAELVRAKKAQGAEQKEEQPQLAL